MLLSGTMKKYSVVLFTAANETSVVPSVWKCDKEDGQWCYFPPSSVTDAKFNRAVAHCQEADNSWQAFRCRTLYESDDLLKARQKSKQSEENNTSNLESEVEMPGKRPQRKRIVYESDGDSSDQPSQPSSSHQKKTLAAGKASFPPLPAVREPPIHTKTVTGPSGSPSAVLATPLELCYDVSADSGMQSSVRTPAPYSSLSRPLPSTSPAVLSPPLDQCFGSSAESVIQSSIMRAPIPYSTLARPLPSTSPAVLPTSLPQQQSSTSTSSTSAGPVTDFERCLLRNMLELKHMIAEVQKSQTLLTSKVDQLMRFTGVTSGAVELPDEIKFPIMTLQQLDLFEQQMKDSQLKSVVIRSISTIGGSSVKETTKRLLRHVLADKCARNVNWKGKNNKRAFAEMELKNIIFRAVRLNPLTSKAADHAIETEVKEWLKFASERDGGKKNREQRKRSSRPQLELDCN